jgi:FtsP/CotA-like multicopper oxidase with cupredoxin domain
MPGPQAAPTATAWPFTGAAPSADPGRTDVIYVFSGGAEGEDWLINGEAFPDVTVQSVALGGSAVIEVRNLSATEHPFHLHGYRFEVLSVNGEPPATHTVEDTVNVPIRAALRLLLVADNPGDWMAHCHLLQHAEDGMMSVLRVE